MLESDGGTNEPAPFPERVGRYELLLPIASGGMATVYLARASGPGGFEREVALKLTHAHLRTEGEFAASLMDEGNLAGRIRHQNVVSVLDVGEDPHGVYLVMEYVEGETLSGLARLADEAETRLPPSVVVRVVDDVLAGLHVAHELCDSSGAPLGLVHRDVTPHNVLVGVDGVSKLADFGVAKAATRLAMTATGLIKGKVAYMAPEQALGRPLNRRCDIWAAGVMLWELFAGMRLHTTTSDAATLLRIVSEPPPRVTRVAPDVPVEIEEVISRALEMDPARRYATAEELSRALEAAAQRSCGRAELREVGTYVYGLVEDRLERRRRKIDEVLTLRGQLSKITRTSLASRLRTPSAVQQVMDPHGGTTRIEQAMLFGGDTVTQPQSQPSHPSAAPGSQPGLDETRRDVTPSHHDLTPSNTESMTALDRISAVDAAPEPTHTDTISVSTPKAESIAPPERRRRTWLFVGAAAGLVGAVGVAAIASRSDTNVELAAPSAAATTKPAATPSASPQPKGVSPDELPLDPGPEGKERSVRLIAKAPIRAVIVGDRRVDFTRAAREQDFTVMPGEHRSNVTVLTNDGRWGVAELSPDSDRFDVVLGDRGSPRPRPAVKSPRPRPESAPEPEKSSGGLLTNPYGKQK